MRKYFDADGLRDKIIVLKDGDDKKPLYILITVKTLLHSLKVCFLPRCLPSPTLRCLIKRCFQKKSPLSFCL